jgi:hypothetical protein
MKVLFCVSDDWSGLVARSADWLTDVKLVTYYQLRNLSECITVVDLVVSSVHLLY